MAVYLLADTEIHDPEAYERYKEAAPEYVARHGGEYCHRYGEFEFIVEGDWSPERLLVIKFPSRQAYDEFMADPDYKPWKELRESITTPKNVLLLEGYDVPQTSP